MEKKSNYIFPLEELLALIKASGYELSIQQILDIQASLLTMPVSRMKPERLKYLITPVIAKNDEEQRHIHRIIDAYVAEKIKTATPAVHPFARWRHQHKNLLFALKVAGFAAIVITGILFYLANNNKTSKKVSQKPVAIQHDSTKASSAPEKQPVDKPSINEAPTKAGNNKLNIIARPSGQYIVPVPIDFNLQMAGTFGTIMGVILAWIIFYDRKKKMEMKEKQRADDAIFIKRTENKKRSAGSGFEAGGELAQPTVQFSERDHLLHQPRGLQKIKSYLKKPAAVQHPALDIKKSIAKSARSAGFTSLVYASEWKDRKYLFLSDHQQRDAHITCLLNHVVQSISAAVGSVARYTYNGDAAMVQDENGNWISLEDLAWQYKTYHLIITGTGYPFFDRNGQLKKELTETFQTWASRSIITPTPLPDWSQPEEQLQKSKFQLVPADIDAVELLAKAIIEDNFISTQQLGKRLPHAYSISAGNFQSAQGLKHYLDDDRLFQLVCSLAVYPRLQWSLTLALFDALLKNNTANEPPAELSYELLLKICRIPWLYSDKLDDNIRLELLNALTVETEVIARETILELLNDARHNTAPDSPAFTELNTQYNINAFFLFSYDQYKYRQYADAKAVISDYWKDLTEWALIEHVDRSGSALMPRYKSGHSSVQEFLLQEKQFEKWNINFLKVALLTLPAILLYILFAVFTPEFVYPRQLYKNVSFATTINKDNNCTSYLKYVINSTNGRSDTIVLNQQFPVDTIPVQDVKYNEMINLELWTKDSLMHPLSFTATDSFFQVNASCK